MVGLRVDDHVIAAGKPQRQNAARFGNVETERLRVEFLRLGDVVRRKTAERFAFF